MNIKSILGVTCLALSAVSFNANASVVKTLNGVDYAWLKLTATIGMSRADVELRLADSNDALFGYQYANAEQIEALFTSYASWDGLDGIHTNGTVVNGILGLVGDFGYTFTSFATQEYPYYATSVDTYDSNNIILDNAPFTDQIGFSGHYGDRADCSGGSCMASASYIYGSFGFAGNQSGSAGWGVNSGSAPNLRLNEVTCISCGHFLVTTDMSLATVPVPATIWLFGSGLIGLIGVARRKAQV